MKNLLLFILCLTIAGRSFSQYEEKPPAPEEVKGFDKSKLFFGGSFGLSFGDQTLINVSPQVGYRFSPMFAAGAGINFIYSSVKSYFNGDVYSRTSLGYAGLNVFGRIYPIQFILLQAQPELNYNWGKEKYTDGTPAYQLPGKFVPSLLLGAGAAIPAGRGAFIIMGQYDVIQDPRAPYGNNIFLNFGYNIGF